MTAALTNLRESEAFQSTNGLSPETCLRLGTCGLERRQERRTAAFEWKFLQVQLGSFLEIGHRLFHRIALGCRASFGTLGHPQLILLAEDCGENSGCHDNDYSAAMAVGPQARHL